MGTEVFYSIIVVMGMYALLATVSLGVLYYVFRGFIKDILKKFIR